MLGSNTIDVNALTILSLESITEHEYVLTQMFFKMANELMKSKVLSFVKEFAHFETKVVKNVSILHFKPSSKYENYTAELSKLIQSLKSNSWKS